MNKPKFSASYYLKNIIDSMDITVEQFAGISKISLLDLKEVISGAKITKSIAKKLAKTLDTAADSWLNLQKKHEEET